jgi:hypothetical protein
VKSEEIERLAEEGKFTQEDFNDLSATEVEELLNNADVGCRDEVSIGGEWFSILDNPNINSYFYCDYHERYEVNREPIETPDGLMCQEGLEADYVWSDYNNEYILRDDAVRVGDDYVYDNQAYYSEYHDRYIIEDEQYWSDHYDSYMYDNELVYCERMDEYLLPEDCDTGYIHQYGYQPVFVPKKLEYENTTLMGLEIELNTDDSPEDTSVDLQELLEDEGIDDRVYFCYDGSINDGFEIITQPATRLWMHKHKFIHKLMTAVKALKMYADESTGLHIHITNDKLYEKDYWKVAKFIKDNYDKLWRLYRRHPNSYCSRISDEDIEFFKRKRFHSVNRYLQVNFQGIGVEFRMFASTTDEKEVNDAIQFAESVVDFIVLGGMKWDDYLNYIKHRYARLYKKLGEQTSVNYKTIMVGNELFYPALTDVEKLWETDESAEYRVWLPCGSQEAFMQLLSKMDNITDSDYFQDSDRFINGEFIPRLYRVHWIEERRHNTADSEESSQDIKADNDVVERINEVGMLHIAEWLADYSE